MNVTRPFVSESLDGGPSHHGKSPPPPLLIPRRPWASDSPESPPSRPPGRQARTASGARPLMLAAAFLVLADVHAGGLASVQGADRVTVRLALDGAWLEGTPVAWNAQQVLFLARNGFLFEFAPDQVGEFQEPASGFRPWSQSEMRGQLQKEFGRRFDVSGTGNYLVVHPSGERDRWASRFEELFRSFVHYFSVRGMQPAPPEFPLVAIVFHSQQEFAQYVEQTGGSAPPGILGFYSPRTNRVILYDMTSGEGDDANWYVNAETIIHEATHQMAFNTHIHNRCAVPPRWAGEGLAMLFEAPGVWDARHHPNAQDRINVARLEMFRRYLEAGRHEGQLGQFVSQSERVFAAAPSVAYAESWALSFFLSEKEPSRYMKYLARTAQREPLTEYSPAEQLREFTDVFGTDLKMLEARFLRFIRQLP